MRHHDKRSQILNAAVRVFARKGYYNARVADVAKSAGIASGTIYLYFKNKDALLVTLFREKLAEFVDSVRKAIDREPDARSKIRQLVRLHFEQFETNVELAEVVQVELRQGHKFFRGALAQEVTTYFALIRSVLEEGIDRGLFRRDLPVKVATKVLFGAMDQMTTSWVLGKREYRLGQTADAVADLFLNGIVAEREER
jgi:TetR/AcrR family fatty acid metabolism transcriptional regulator